MQIVADFAPDKPAVPETLAAHSGICDVSGFHVDVISSLEALDAIAGDWAVLESASEPSAIFQSFAHVRIWARHFIGKERATHLHVAVVREAGRPVLVLPLAISGSRLLRIADVAGDPVAQYADVLADPARVSRGAFEAALASVRAAGADAIVLRGVRDDSELLRLAGPSLRPATARTVAPFADLSGFADFTAYRESLSKKVRRALRHRRNHLENGGNFSFEMLGGGTEARAIVADALDMKRKWLVQRGNISSAFLDPATKACLLDLADSHESSATVARLVVGGETAAIRFGFEYRGTHFAYMSAYDPRFADVSPGKLLMEHCISGFWTRGIGRLDMLPPEGRHKRDWCRQEVGSADYTLPLTGAGRAYAEIYLERVRPGMKRLFERMPKPMRSLAAALFVNI